MILDKRLKFWLLLLFQLFLILQIKAQSEVSNNINTTTFLIKNTQKVLPLINLPEKTLVIQTDFIGQQQFNATVSKYVNSQAIKLSQFQKELNQYRFENQKIIIPIDIDNVSEIPTFLYPIIPLKDIIVVMFSKESPQKINLETIEYPTIIYSNKDLLSIETAAQSIFGGAPLHNLKGEKVIDGNSRLGYTLPQLVGIDSTFLNEKIDSVVRFALESEAFPGVQILVAKEGKVIFHKTYGFQTYSKKHPTELTDIYDLASISKVTTSLPILMKYYGNDKFDLEAPLKKYFPKFKRSNKSDLKMREILAHQSGLKPWIPYWQNTLNADKSFKRRTFKTKKSRRYNVFITEHLFLHRKYKKKIYRAIKKSEVSEIKKYKYSGLAFYILPEIVESLTGEDYQTFLQNEFYKPLGANTITFNPLKIFPKERIIPTEQDTFFRKIQIHGMVHDEGAAMMGGVSSNAGLFASANDLAKLMQMYLNGGEYGGKRYFAEKAIKEFTRCQFPENKNRRGLGFDKPLLEYHPANSSVAKDASPSSYGHSGYTGTFVWVDPEHELIYIFLSNRVHPTRENRKIYQLNIRPDIHQIIYDSFLKEN